jgi:hypothetical protein
MRARLLSLQWRIAWSRIAQQPVRILQRLDRSCQTAVAEPPLPTRSCEKPQLRKTAVAKNRSCEKPQLRKTAVAKNRSCEKPQLRKTAVAQPRQPNP